MTGALTVDVSEQAEESRGTTEAAGDAGADMGTDVEIDEDEVSFRGEPV